MLVHVEMVHRMVRLMNFSFFSSSEYKVLHLLKGYRFPLVY